MSRTLQTVGLAISGALVAGAAILWMAPGGESVAHSTTLAGTTAASVSALVDFPAAAPTAGARQRDGGSRVMDLRPQRRPTMKSNRYAFTLDFAVPTSPRGRAESGNDRAAR